MTASNNEELDKSDQKPVCCFKSSRDSSKFCMREKILKISRFRGHLVGLPRNHPGGSTFTLRFGGVSDAGGFESELRVSWCHCLGG